MKQLMQLLRARCVLGKSRIALLLATIREQVKVHGGLGK
jgi:hypothetical protein